MPAPARPHISPAPSPAFAIRPYSWGELEALWDRWYNHPDPDVARLTSDEIDRLFETIWGIEGYPSRPALPTRQERE